MGMELRFFFFEYSLYSPCFLIFFSLWACRMCLSTMELLVEQQKKPIFGWQMVSFLAQNTPLDKYYISLTLLNTYVVGSGSPPKIKSYTLVNGPTLPALR